MVARVCSLKYVHARFRNRIVRHFRVIKIVRVVPPNFYIYSCPRANFFLLPLLLPELFVSIGDAVIDPFALSLAGSEEERNGGGYLPIYHLALLSLSLNPVNSTKRRDRNTIARNVSSPDVKRGTPPSFLPFELLRDHSTLGKMTLNVQ